MRQLLSDVTNCPVIGSSRRGYGNDMTEEWKWLDEPPVFSVERKRWRNVVRVPHGVTLAPLGARYVGVVVAFALSIGVTIAASGFIIERAMAMQDAVGWWGLAVAVPALAVAVFTGSGVYVDGTERIMMTSALAFVLLAALFCGVAVGFALSAVNQTSLVPWSNDGYIAAAATLQIPAAICAATGVVFVILAVSSVRAARADVRRVLRLRQTGRRQGGVITRRPEPETWDDGGDVPIRYGAGVEERAIVTRMNTYAHRIPVPGSRVIVFTDSDGSLLVEIDPEHPLEFIANSSPYESDTSGGGS